MLAGITHLSSGEDLAGVYPYYTVYKRMLDNVNRKLDGRYKQSDCHSIFHTTHLDAWPSGSLTDGRTFTRSTPVFPISPSDVNGILPDVPDSLTESLCVDAFNTMSTQIPTEVSIANFSWELREIGELVPSILNKLGSVSKSASDGYLNFAFGWKPFLGDLQKLANIFSTTNAKIEHLIATWGKKTRLSYFRAKVIDDVILTPVLHNVGDFGTAVRIGVVGHRADFRASGRLFHKLRELRSLAGTIRAFTSAVGLNNPVKAFWDAIPYSFIAGWFTRIGQHLGALAINPFKGQWEVTGVTFSYVERIVIYAFKKEPYDGIFDVDAGRIEVKRYTRYDGFPVGVTSFNLNDLNPSQLSLFAALIVGQHR